VAIFLLDSRECLFIVMQEFFSQCEYTCTFGCVM